ncbi:MAG: DNA starvation/stationary phase protection protein [Bacteroidota bacterium]
MEPRKKVYKRLGYTSMDTAVIVKQLNELLANYHVHYQKLRNFHWNVKGRDFFELHEKFEELYNEVKLNIDEIAERIRVFGQTPLSTMKDYLETSEIKEDPTDLHADIMVHRVVEDFRILLTKMVDAANAAIDIGDVGTEDMINTMINETEKRHWMFNAWLQDEPLPEDALRKEEFMTN